MSVVYGGVAIATILSTVFWSHPAAASQPIVSGEETRVVVTVIDVATRGGVVSGTLVNHSHRLVRDIRLLIHHTWHWKNERHPGEYSPGRADYYTVEDQITPGGTLQFTYPVSPALPVRTDGHFTTSGEVVRFTEVGE